MTRLLRLPSYLAALLALLAGAGCATGSFSGRPGDTPPVSAKFYLEARDGDPATAIPLPLSGIRVPIDPGPVLFEADIEQVQVGRTDAFIGPFLRFRLNAAAARDLSRMTSVPKNRGLRLVLSFGGQLIGIATINGPITNGQVDVFPEVIEAADVGKIADGINAACYEISRR